MWKRLVRDSFILSCTRSLSSRFVRFFENGPAKILFSSAKKVDFFVRDRVTGPLFKKIGIRKSFSMPARNAIASFIEHNTAAKSLSSLRNAFLNTSMRSVGVFLLTFGIYAAAIFLLKSYVSLTLGSAANPDDFAVSALFVLVGLLLTAFGDKNILRTVGSSKIIGSLLSNCLGVNDSSFDRYKVGASGTAVGISFLLGSLFGVSTLFFAPASVMLLLVQIIAIIAIFHIPEFGLLLGISAVSFVPVSTVSTVMIVTFVSYFIKCIRLKRNFRFGTADAVMLLVFIAVFISCAVSESAFSLGERYLLCFTAVYFLAKNLLCSEKLVNQTFNALTVGASVGMALYILGDFATLIPQQHLRNAALSLSRHTLEPNMLAMLVSALLPFALSSLSRGNAVKKRNGFVLLALACAVFVDSTLFWILLIISAFVYIAFVYKAPFGALLGAAVVIPPVAVLANDYTLTGVVSFGTRGIYDSAFNMATDSGKHSFWGSFAEVGGIVGLVLFVVGLVLVFQRVLAHMSGVPGSKTVRYGGVVAAEAVMMLICGSIFNPFSDLRIYAAMWFIFGLCGAMYKVISLPQNDSEVS